MFFLLPVGVDYRARRYPVVTFTLMGLCILIYFVTFSFENLGDAAAVDDWVYGHFWLIPSESRWWTFLTCQFVHGGFWHVTGNMIYLFIFGSCVEDMIGRVHYIFFYLLCGIIADFSHILLSAEHFSSSIPMGGASGAISGCIGGFLLLLAKSRIEFRWVVLLFFRFWSGVFWLPAWLVISFWFLDDFSSMILSRTGGGEGGVAFGAHMGGTLGGMVLVALERIRLKRNGTFDELEEEEDYEPVAVAPTYQTMAQRRAQSRVVTAEVQVPLEPATIYLSWNGANYGPYSPSQIQPMFKLGQIPEAATYWQQGMEEWRAAGELREPGSG